MSHTVWRIATDTPEYEAHDLSGGGGRKTEGRWHEKGTPVVYASESRALACLETVVHLGARALPLNRYLVEITIPDDVRDNRRLDSIFSLDVGWDAEPPGKVSIQVGAVWLRSGSSALLLVPSVIAHEEFNVLVNPEHPDAPGITARKIRKWLYDPRIKR